MTAIFSLNEFAIKKQQAALGLDQPAIAKA